MNNRWLFIINPKSGQGKVSKHWYRIENVFLKQNSVFDVKFTQYAGHATEIAQKAIDTEEYRHIIGVGGDGTMNEIVNGIFRQNKVKTTDITFTMLPIGTGNDWSYSYKIPNDFTSFTDMILRGHTHFQDIGKVTYFKEGVSHEHYFANAGGMAYDAFVVSAVEAQKNYLFGKKVAYFGYIFKCLWQYKPEKVIIKTDDTVVEDYFYTINLGINKRSGGGVYLTPQAVNDDGLMALTLVRNMPKWLVALYTPKLRNGTIGDVKKYVSLLQAQNIHIDSPDKPIYIETDSEILGHTPIEISVLEKKLKVIIP